VVPRRLRDLGADIYHSLYYAMPYRPGVPVVLTSYDVIPLVFPEYFSPHRRHLFRITHTLAVRVADLVIAISEATKRDLVHWFGLDPDKVKVIYPAVGAEFAPSAADEVRSVRGRYGLDEGYFLSVGTNKPHKNLVRLIHAFADYLEKRPLSSTLLALAGPWDPRYPEPKEAVRERGLGERVRFLGPIEDRDLPALYSGARALAFPSEYEGFGLPVLEAMACGAPVVCSNSSSLPEVLGDTGLLVDPADRDGWTAALGRMEDDDRLRREYRERGLARAREFTWERNAELTVQVYRELAGETAR
jgi:alpha-1,3-rhamnosyl/mannosyltransferase